MAMTRNFSLIFWTQWLLKYETLSLTQPQTHTHKVLMKLSDCTSVCALQVAEMHGELIEFNERLYRSLMAKDHLIVQMRQELIDLRGPVSVHTHVHMHTRNRFLGCNFFALPVLVFQGFV